MLLVVPAQIISKNTPSTMSSSILVLLPLLLLLLLLSPTINAWTPRLSASHFSGRFFHAHNTGGVKSLKATEKNNQEDKNDPNNDNNNSSNNNNNTADKDENKKKRTYLNAEYLSQLESLYDASAAVASSSSLLESLTEDYHDITSTSNAVSSSSSSPGQSLLYGEKTNTIVLGDWMGWEEGGKSHSSCLGENCGDDSEVREREKVERVDFLCIICIADCAN